MIKAYRAADVRAAEAPLLAAGEPLMERASGALTLATIREVSASGRPVYGCRAFVLAGGGDNGGDALYAAARLAARGMSVKAFVPGRAHEGGLAAALRAGVRLAELEEARRADVWIDGLVGIGARGPLREPLASHVRALSGMRSGQRVVAVDVPSGIGTDDGTVPGPVLDCDLTVTMGAPKPGLYLEPARRHAGRVEVADIGLSLGEPALVSLQEEDARGMWPVPGPDSHKYTRGVLGVMAGSRRYPGAGFLCADAPWPPAREWSDTPGRATSPTVWRRAIPNAYWARGGSTHGSSDREWTWTTSAPRPRRPGDCSWPPPSRCPSFSTPGRSPWPPPPNATSASSSPRTPGSSRTSSPRWGRRSLGGRSRRRPPEPPVWRRPPPAPRCS